ncbi:MAG: cellulose biosynthesis protein CelD [Caulobacter sp. 12-67-6]|nr:MAG: cellulose biosynthesis protein CelD [Caulobacter sp. 12-67-6]OYX68031.1 MAG: cellulose biosynthesis protein CelD [Caulobacter sp. 32-67-35]
MRGAALDNGVSVETVKVSELGAPERARWNALRQANPLLGSPYFDLRFVEAAGEIAPGAAVAVIRQGGEILGFLPFQRRGTLVQPLAAPMSDIHGLVAPVDTGLNLTAILSQLGADRARFGGLIGQGVSEACGLSVRYAMAADVSAGFAAYEAGRSAGFLKDKRRRLRMLERDHGPVSFSFEKPAAAMLDMIVAGKRQQLHRTHQYDIFGCGWTETLLRRLAEVSETDFGLKLAVLRAGDVVVAAELGMTSGDRHHLWFPIYDAAYARYSPGSLMTLETLRAAAEQGIARVDFGPGGEAYKRDFAEPAEPVFEGMIHARSGAVGLTGLPGMTRLARRFDGIIACEPGLVGRLRGASSFVTAMTRRHPRIGAGVGLGVGLGLSLTLLVD